MIKPSMRRVALWTSVAALLVAGYAAIGFFAVPHFVRSQMQDFARTQYQRQLAIGEIRFNPFTLQLDMRDLALPGGESGPVFSFEHLFVDLDISSIWKRGPSFRAILLEGPFVDVIVGTDGTLNLAELARPLQEARAERVAARSGKPARLYIDHLEVRAGHCRYEDHVYSTPFVADLEPISFELHEFSTTADTGNAYALKGMSSRGERFDWQGTISVAPLQSRGTFRVEALQAATVSSYLRESAPFELSAGDVAINGSYEYSGAVSPNVFDFALQDVVVNGLGVRPRGRETNYVDLTRLEVHDARAQLLRRALDIGSIRVAGGTVQTWMNPDRTVNLLDLTRPATEAAVPATPGAVADVPTAEPATPASEPPAESGTPANRSAAASAAQSGAPAPPGWTINAPDISVADLALSFVDRGIEPNVSIKLSPLNVHVQGYSNTPDARLAIAVDSKVNETASLKAQIDGAANMASLKGHVDLADLELPPFQPYLAQQTSMTLKSGLLTTAMDVERIDDGGFSARGNASIAHLLTIDNELQKDFIKWEELALSDVDFRASPLRLHIGGVVANVPYARVIVEPDRTVNVMHVLSSSSAPPVAASSVTASSTKPGSNERSANTAPMVVVDKIEIRNGSANYADLWIQPNFAVGIEELSGSITGLSSDPKSHAKLELNGKVDRYAPAHIVGEVNPFSATAYSNLQLTFRGVELTSITPYSGRFAGYKIVKGKLNADLNYKVEDRALTADHHFVIDQLQLGERVESPEATKLPVRLAVALLQDRNGVIDIALPVSGSLDDPQFRVGPIILKAFVNLIAKAVTAPFKLLGSLFGGQEDMNFIDFAPGDATLDPAAQEKLASVVKALESRPGLELDVPESYAPDADGAVLGAQQLDAKLLAIKRQELDAAGQSDTAVDPSMLADPAERLRLLVAQYALEHGPDATLPEVAALTPPADNSNDRKKKTEPVPPLAPEAVDAAIAALTAALSSGDGAPEADLKALGQARAHAIQDALLASARSIRRACSSLPPRRRQRRRTRCASS
jgi:hypothetical protein